MLEDNKIVQSIEARVGGRSGTYWRVTWQDGKADNIFNGDWLPLLEQSQEENRLLHFTKEKKEGSQYYNIVSLALADLPVVESTHLEPSGALTVKEASKAKAEPPPVKPEAMTKTDWSEKDRITRKSIERQTALKEATNISCAMIAQGKEMSATKTIEIARLFEAYLEGYSLVGEAKKLLEKGG